MIIRSMNWADKHTVFDKAKDLAAAMYPQLRIDVKRVSDQLENPSRFDYAKVVQYEGAVRGALIARVGPNLWAQRDHAAILLWYCNLPGGGAKLLRNFREWVSSTRRIRVAGFAHDTVHMNTTMLKLAERVGFKRNGGAYLFYN